MPSLFYLDLSNNHLNGNMTNNIGQLHQLSYLDLSSNYFHGIISEDHLSNFTNMKHLYLSFNSLTLSLDPYWTPPFQLYSIGLRSCNIWSPFPRWLQTQTSLYYIDLSSNQISGTIPNWFWNLSSKAPYLNISHNKIHGKVPRETFSQNSSMIVDLSFNYFEGRLPLFNTYIVYVDLSNNKFTGTLSSLCNLSELAVLDLSNNNLSGELPRCWKEESYGSLLLLSLSNNNLTGNLHNLPCPSPSPQLRVLQLQNNSFVGPLPSSLSNCTYLRVLDVASNMISGSIPKWIGNNLLYLHVLILWSNKFSGSIPPNLCLLQRIQLMDLSHNNLSGGVVDCLYKSTALTSKTLRGLSLLFRGYLVIDIYPANVTDVEGLMRLQKYSLQFSELLTWKGRQYEYNWNLEDMAIVDFSSNKLQGKIPEEFGNLIGLVQLNLSNNNLTGCIPQRIGEMRKLEVLDLSSNHLSGEIPQSISNLNFLNYLNLSNNNLAGRIPRATQIQTLSAASFMGNPELCGDPLPKKCHEKEEAKAPSPTNMGGHKDKDGFYISLCAGFVIAFWGVLGSQLFHDFSLMNKASNWVYMRSALIIAKIRRR